jgi:hypothetical protein
LEATPFPAQTTTNNNKEGVPCFAGTYLLIDWEDGVGRVGALGLFVTVT